jgi:hypothetical protein
MKILKRVDATVTSDVSFYLVVDSKDPLDEIESKLRDYVDDNWEEWAEEPSLSVNLSNSPLDLKKAFGGKMNVYTWNGEELEEVVSDDEVQEFIDSNSAEEAEAEMLSRQLKLEV